MLLENRLGITNKHQKQLCLKKLHNTKGKDSLAKTWIVNFTSKFDAYVFEGLILGSHIS